MRDKDLETLETLLRGMAVPERRRRDLGWLSRNLAIHNEEHPNFEQARQHIMKMMRKDKK